MVSRPVCATANLLQTRCVEPELLDALAVCDPRAQRSRADLRRIHRVMGSLRIMRRALDRATALHRPQRLLELGAGDGTLMLRLARQRAAHWPALDVTLLDRLNATTARTLEDFFAVGWQASTVTMDLFDWLTSGSQQRWDVICANLFLHHFEPPQLQRLMSALAARTRVFFCCEPRRSTLALTGSRLLALLGAGAVTRQDAVASVRAGFCAQELSGLWPDAQHWQLEEYSAGLFSHVFIAVRKTS